MPPKRKSEGESADTANKKSKKSTAAAAPRLKKSQRVEWPSYCSDEEPESEWARKCIERWCLLAPYDTRLTDENWKNYYQERSALDAVNTSNSTASKPIVSEELGQNTFALLRKASASVANVIYGAMSEEEGKCTEIARTLRGSLYYTALWVNDEEAGDSNPRTVNSKTRLYSPFGLGTSLDIVYDYHYRCFRQNERYSTLLVYSRDIDNCNPKEPLKSMAVFRDKQGRQKPDPESVKVINMNGAKITGTTAKNLAEFEEMLFGGSGWLSTLKVFQLVAFAGTVGHYNEALRGSLLKKGGLEKFKLFKDETDGKSALRTADDKLLAELEAKEVQGTNEEGDKVDEICIPQRLLLLAKRTRSGKEVAEDQQEV